MLNYIVHIYVNNKFKSFICYVIILYSILLPSFYYINIQQKNIQQDVEFIALNTRADDFVDESRISNSISSKSVMDKIVNFICDHKVIVSSAAIGIIAISCILYNRHAILDFLNSNKVLSNNQDTNGTNIQRGTDLKNIQDAYTQYEHVQDASHYKDVQDASTQCYILTNVSYDKFKHPLQNEIYLTSSKNNINNSQANTSYTDKHDLSNFSECYDNIANKTQELIPISPVQKIVNNSASGKSSAAESFEFLQNTENLEVYSVPISPVLLDETLCAKSLSNENLNDYDQLLKCYQQFHVHNNNTSIVKNTCSTLTNLYNFGNLYSFHADNKFLDSSRVIKYTDILNPEYFSYAIPSATLCWHTLIKHIYDRVALICIDKIKSSKNNSINIYELIDCQLKKYCTCYSIKEDIFDKFKIYYNISSNIEGTIYAKNIKQEF